MEDLNYYIDQIKSLGISIDDYNSWISDIGLPLASRGEEGREAFHQISSTSTKYDYQSADEKFTQLINSHNGQKKLDSLYYYFNHSLGIKPPKVSYKPKEPKELPKAKEEEKRIYNIEDILLAPPEETIWAYITKGVNNAIVASSEAGKSTLIMNLAVAVANCKNEFLGWELTALKNSVLIISTEDGLPQLKKRFEALTANNPIDDIDAIRIIMDASDLLKTLKKALEERPSDLVFIDTWGDLVAGDYDAKSTRQTMAEILKVCKEYDATPVYIHHTNKASENIPHKSSIKGAGDFEQACRVVMMLSIFQESRWLCCVKGNPFEDGHKNTCYELSFHWESQTVGITGNQLPRKEIIDMLRTETMGRPAMEINWADILKEPTRRKDLIPQVMAYSNLSEAAVKKRISTALEVGDIQKDKNGLYTL